MSDKVTRHYRPEPTPRLFHDCDWKFRGIMGPTGSGKSSAMVLELYWRALQQAPDSTGMRRTRWGVFRTTYPSLVSTTLKTWDFWMPQAKIIMSPTIHWHWVQRKALSDGTGVDMEVIFIAVEDPRTDIAKLRSLELTGAWINEAQEIRDKSIVDWIENRCGRFPPREMAPLTWSGAIADANAMSTDHWWYEMAEVVKPMGYQFWHQPPALLHVEGKQEGAMQDGMGGWWIINPKCENKQYIPKGDNYWLEQVPGKSDEWIRRNLCAEYGATLEGRPVYPEFVEERHVSKDKEPLKPIPGITLQIGMDFGLTPSACICQITPEGQLRVIDECGAVGKGMRQFLRDDLKALLNARYPGYEVMVIGEPSGNRRAESDESTAVDEIRGQGFRYLSAPTNIFRARREAVAAFMLKRVQSAITGKATGEGFVISPTCATLLKGFREKYVYRKVGVPGREIWKDEPEKNETSHYHDALQAVAVTYDKPRLASSAFAAQQRGTADLKADYAEFPYV